MSGIRRTHPVCILALLALAALQALMAFPAVAQAADTPELQDLDAIRATAQELLLAQAEGTGQDTGREVIATAGYLDPRLRLTRCAGKLIASRPPGATLAARNTVGVTCPDGTAWTVYVPVLLESEGPVLVTKRSVPRGAAMGPADVETRVLRLPGLATHYVSSAEGLAGKLARRLLPPGTSLSIDDLAVEAVVKRGQQVTLVAAVGGIEVRAHGKALTDGGTSERIRVQNLGSLRIVEGRVESADIVRITP